MALELSDVQRIAQLAQLEVSDSEIQKTAQQINNILDLVEQLKNADTADIEPLAHPISAFEDDVSLRLREDEVTQADHRDEYQRCAPATGKGLYLVPKVIE